MKVFRLALLFLMLGAAIAFAADFYPGEIVVRFKPGVVSLPRGAAVSAVRAAAVSAASVRGLNSKHGVTRFRQLYTRALAIRPDWTYLADTYVLSVPPDKDIVKAAKEYKNDANVADASPNTIVRAFRTPNDPKYTLGDQWGLIKIQAASGWNITIGTTESLIAVLDTGINYNHEDFAGKVNRTYAWDYINSDNDPMDDYGHGTACSGVIGAVTDNGIGVAGVDWQGKILPMKVLNSSGVGPITNVTAALLDLAALKSTGVKIVAISMSLGQSSPDSNLEAACRAASNEGIVLVAAAGNENTETLTYPAAYTSVLAVAATDSNDKRSDWGASGASNYGTWVDVSAPGTTIMTTNKEGTYSNSWSGTSLACPFVAGLASLIKAANPALTNIQIMTRIEETADNIDSLNPGYQGKLGTGRINVYQALNGLTISGSIESPASGEVFGGRKTVLGKASGLGFSRFTLEALRNGSVEALIKQSTTAVDTGHPLGTWETTGLNGAYVIKLKVFANDGASLESNRSVTVDNISPEVGITLPLPGATITGLTQITGKAKDLNFDNYVLEYAAGANPSVYQTIGTYYTPVDGAVLGNWETSGLSGAYTLRLRAIDRAGNSAATSEILSISGQAPTKEIEPETGLPLTFALPNPFNTTTATETAFVYDLKGNFNAVVYLFDLSGNLIWRNSYPAGENGGKAGRNTPGWNGKNLFGEKVDNGVYVYQITADGKVIGRGKVIVLN